MSENLSDNLKGLQTIKPAGMWDAGGSDNEDRKDISGRRQVKLKKTLARYRTRAKHSGKRELWVYSLGSDPKTFVG